VYPNIFTQKWNQQIELVGSDIWQAIKQQKINFATITALTLSYSPNILATPVLIRNTQVKLNIFLSHPQGYYIYLGGYLLLNQQLLGQN
jgi:hypothetical protein